jgi:hypothetical protein
LPFILLAEAGEKTIGSAMVEITSVTMMAIVFTDDLPKMSGLGVDLIPQSIRATTFTLKTARQQAISCTHTGGEGLGKVGL